MQSIATHPHYLNLTMIATNKQMARIIKNILRDIQVEMADEFDKNFEREAFFSEAWERRKSPTRPGGHILVDSSTLRRSVRSEVKESSIVFFSDLPYAAIHNDGGEIVVTNRMKRYFWYKYYSTTGSFGRKKNGERRNDRRTNQLATEAEFWKFMALKKEGSTIRIPQRRFLGNSPAVEAAVREIIEDNIGEYLNTLDFNIK